MKGYTIMKRVYNYEEYTIMKRVHNYEKDTQL